MVLNWDDYYMSLVYLTAMKSKDTSSHLGAVIVGSSNELRSMGYNGICRYVKDDIPERNERPEKYYWYEHAERNAIYNSLLAHTSVDGCTMYTNGTPCAECGRAIIQSGITEVVVDSNWDSENAGIGGKVGEGTDWSISCNKSAEMFREAGVILRRIDYKPIMIEKFRRGKQI